MAAASAVGDLAGFERSLRCIATHNSDRGVGGPPSRLGPLPDSCDFGKTMWGLSIAGHTANLLPRPLFPKISDLTIHQSSLPLPNINALAITLTDDSAIAPPASTGLSRPSIANGMPTAL